MKKMFKNLIEAPEHIMEAREMASAIYRHRPSEHVAMIKEIKNKLVELHEGEAFKIDNI